MKEAEFDTLIKDEILGWASMSIRTDEPGETQFYFGDKEIGHLHNGRTLHVMLPRAMREEVLTNGLAEKHPWVPNSGVSFRVREEGDVKRALWLLRLSYLRFALKNADSAPQLLEQESRELPLTPQFQALRKPFLRSEP